MQMAVPKGRADYEPNSLAEHSEIGGPRECPMTGFNTSSAPTGDDEQGDKLRVRAELFADHYSQARLFWKSMTDNERARIASSFVFELSKVGMLAAVPPRMVANLRNVDEELAQRVADGLGIPLPKKAKAAREPIDMEPSPALSIQKNMKETIEGRAIGVLIADGSDGAEIKKVVDAVIKAGGKAVIVAPKVGGAKLADGSMMKADGQLAGSPSQIFDAVAIILSDEGCKALLYQGAAVQFAMDAFGHLKAIGASVAAKPLLDKAGIEPDEGVTDLGAAFVTAAAKRFYDRESKVRMLA
ncbi:MAG: catalase [Sphingomonas bacterium]|jgi:catalase|nr:catalase [Sphingomonas bacterium]